MTDAYTRRVENLLGVLAITVSEDIARAIDAAAGRGGASGAALVQIDDHPGLTIDDLRRRLGLTHSAAVRLVPGLEEQGLVERHRRMEDARAVELRLTRSGRTQAAVVRTRRAEVLARTVGALGEEDRDTLERLLTAMLGAMPRSVAHSVRMCRLCDLSGCPADDCPVEQRYLALRGDVAGAADDR